MQVPLRRYGGKVYLAKWIIEHFPKHELYVEPFCGSGAVFFTKDPSHTEVLNDIDNKITSAFEIMRRDSYALAAALWATPYSQSNWRDEWRGEKSDVERAAMFIASSQQFYAGSTKHSTFTVCAGHANKPKSKVWADWFRRVLPAAARLKDAVILNEDAFKVIERFTDRENALWYVDPPYMGHEHEYGNHANAADLAWALHGVKGKVIVSGKDAEAALYPTWRQVRRDYVGRAGIGGNAHRKQRGKKYEEVLYLNFPEGT
jgi:DNA adenine methylase